MKSKEEIKFRAQDVLENVLLKEVDKIVKKSGAPYLAFLNIVIGIEFLGACLDERPFIEKNLSEKRFNKALKKLFDKKYHKYSKANNPFYLYENLRCGLVHQIRPLGGIMFTTRSEAITDGNSHLKKLETGELIIVLEDLYEDFENAVNRLIRQVKDKKLTNKKLDDDIITIKK